MAQSLIRFLIVLVFTCLLPASCVRSSSVLPPISNFPRGHIAPNFELYNVLGKKVSLDSFRGRVVLLNFWATWCGPCLQEINSLRSLHEHFQEQPFEIVGVSIDDSGNDLLSYVKRKKIAYPVLIDRSKAVARLYGVRDLPFSLVLDKEGRTVSFPNPKTGKLSFSIIGAYDWDGEETIQAFQSLLKQR